LLLGWPASGALRSRGRPGTDARVAKLEAETECKENWRDPITSRGSERNTKQNRPQRRHKGKKNITHNIPKTEFSIANQTRLHQIHGGHHPLSLI
jgi:hypothetical protein